MQIGPHTHTVGPAGRDSMIGQYLRRSAVPSPRYTPPVPPARPDESNHKPPRRCTVDGMTACFHGFYQKAYTHEAALTIGGFPAGEEAYPVAVVEYENGQVETIPAEMVRFDTGGKPEPADR